MLIMQKICKFNYVSLPVILALRSTTFLSRYYLIKQKLITERLFYYYITSAVIKERFLQKRQNYITDAVIIDLLRCFAFEQTISWLFHFMKMLLSFLATVYPPYHRDFKQIYCSETFNTCVHWKVDQQ